MGIQAGDTFNPSGPFSMQGSGASVLERKVQDVAVIDLTGPLVGALPARVFRDRVEKLLCQGTKKFAVKLAEVPWADSHGVNALAGAYNSIRDAGGHIKFFAASERLVRALARLHLDTVLQLFEDEASALSSFH